MTPNLLPPKEKEILFKDQLKRLVIILGCETFIFLLCLFLVLSSIKFYILGETSSQKFFLNQAEAQNKSSDFSIFKRIISISNQDIFRTEFFRAKQAYFSSAMDILLGVERPQGLYFTNLFLDNVQDKKIKVVITGTSSTRDSMLVYKKNIELEKRIKSIFFSPESWISPKDVNFNISFEISENEN